MLPAVHDQLRLVTERLMAVVTLVWFVPAVHAEVSFQRRAIVEAFFTVLAVVLFALSEVSCVRGRILIFILTDRVPALLICVFTKSNPLRGSFNGSVPRMAIRLLWRLL